MSIKKINQKEYFLEILSIAWSLGFIIVLPMIVFTFLGLWLDNILKIKPVATIFGVLLGTIGGIVSAIKEIKKIK